MTTTPLLFDVDGTLFASGDLVMESYQQALEELGLPPLPEAQLRQVIGPPLAESFRQLAGVPAKHVDHAVKTYRKIYAPKFLEPNLYEGVPELLADLHRAQIPLATATTKLETFAEKQLQHWDLDKFFQVIGGATPDPGSTKTTVVANTLTRLRNQGIDTDGAILIGDRIHDVEGATANQIDMIGVAWGYGEPAEFESPTVKAVARNVTELREVLSL